MNERREWERGIQGEGRGAIAAVIENKSLKGGVCRRENPLVNK